jgi:trimethylamine--corrinoid protein Co-methyltransferase
MEGGLHASYEKMLIDADLLQMVAHWLTPLDVDADALGLDAIREVGPGGHFFGAAHTQSRYKTAFYKPMVSDWRNYESWEEAGSPDTATRAAKVVKDLIAAHEDPPMDDAIRAELDDFVARRVAEGGVATDF